MATPVIQRILKQSEWWAETDTNVSKDNKMADDIYRHMMLKIAREEESKLNEDDKARKQAENELRLERESAVLRAEAHNLLAHNPETWWDSIKNGSPPTSLVVLTGDSAKCLMKLIRRTLKATKPGSSRDAAIELLLVDAQVALNFRNHRQHFGRRAAIKIQTIARMYLAGFRTQEVIYSRWEKQWIAANQCYIYADIWALKAEKDYMNRLKHKKKSEVDIVPFVSPPWELLAQDPPVFLRRKRFNPTATPTTSLGTPRSLKRREKNETKRKEQAMAREKELREISSKREAASEERIHELCSLAGVMSAIKAASMKLTELWDDDERVNDPPYGRFSKNSPSPQQVATVQDLGNKKYEQYEKEQLIDDGDEIGNEISKAANTIAAGLALQTQEEAEKERQEKLSEFLFEAWEEVQEDMAFHEEEEARLKLTDLQNRRASDWSKKHGKIATKLAMVFAKDTENVINSTDKSLEGFPALESEEPSGCRFFIAPQSPWKDQKGSTAQEALKKTLDAYERKKNVWVSEAASIIRKRRGINEEEVTEDVVDLDAFGRWDTPPELKTLRAQQALEKEQELEAVAKKDNSLWADSDDEDDNNEEDDNDGDGDTKKKKFKKPETKEVKKVREEKEKALEEQEMLSKATKLQKKEFAEYNKSKTEANRITLLEYLQNKKAEEDEKQMLLEEEDVLNGNREIQSTNDLLLNFRKRQNEMMICTCAADAIRVLFRDGANVLGALSSAQRIFDNERCWPHRDLFPLPLIVTKEVPALDPDVCSFRSMLVSDRRNNLQLKAMSERTGPRFDINNFISGSTASAVPSLCRYMNSIHNKFQTLLRSIYHPPPSPPEYQEAHEFLVERGVRKPDDLCISMMLLEEMTDMRQEKREEVMEERGGRPPAYLPLYAYCATGTNNDDPYSAVEVIPPFNFARWGMRQIADRFEDKTALLTQKTKLTDMRNQKSRPSTSASSATSSTPNSSRPGSPSMQFSRGSTAIEQDPDSPIAIERRNIANSIVVDVLVDPYTAQLEREERHLSVGDKTRTKFASKERQMYISRIYLFRQENLFHKSRPTFSFSRPSTPEKFRMSSTSNTPPLFPSSPSGGAGDKLPPITSASSVSSTSSSVSSSTLRKKRNSKKDQQEHQMPSSSSSNVLIFPSVVGSAKTYNVENGATPPHLPIVPPQLAMFNWNRDRDAALLLGEASLQQTNFEFSDEDDLKWGWQSEKPLFSPHDEDNASIPDDDEMLLHEEELLHDTSESVTKSNEMKKKNKKKKMKKLKTHSSLSHSKISSLLSAAYLPPSPELLPDLTQPQTFVYRENLVGKFAEFRMRGRALSAKEIRPELPALLQSLVMRDGSEDDDASHLSVASSVKESISPLKKKGNRTNNPSNTQRK